MNYISLKLKEVFDSVNKKYNIGDKVHVIGSDIPYVIDAINNMSYDLVYDIDAEDYAKCRQIYNESFRYVETNGGLGMYRERVTNVPYSQAEIDKADDVITRGARWIVYEQELVAR